MSLMLNYFLPHTVLILILLEMRLLEFIELECYDSNSICLNPYSTGNEVVGEAAKIAKQAAEKGLNPYSTGNEVVGEALKLGLEKRQAES